mmetsp:Transcript_23217/g.53188  ORF Transcript_23217/g.53188 Transcript_23217/m.53188 type:complete len:277 (+) Transcript_23217:103-933(+)
MAASRVLHRKEGTVLFRIVAPYANPHGCSADGLLRETLLKVIFVEQHQKWLTAQRRLHPDKDAPGGHAVHHAVQPLVCRHVCQHRSISAEPGFSGWPLQVSGPHREVKLVAILLQDADSDLVAAFEVDAVWGKAVLHLADLKHALTIGADVHEHAVLPVVPADPARVLVPDHQVLRRKAALTVCPQSHLDPVTRARRPQPGRRYTPGGQWSCKSSPRVAQGETRCGSQASEPGCTPPAGAQREGSSRAPMLSQRRRRHGRPTAATRRGTGPPKWLP